MTLIALLLLPSAALGQTNAQPAKNFAADVSFLKNYARVVVLRRGGAEVAVVPKWQARVMTSALGAAQPGFGWINYDFIKQRKLVPHMNVFGGEDRLWLGPEGGQFALFFKPGAPFDLAHWQTPAPVDAMPFQMISETPTSVTCERNAIFTNYSGTKFHVRMMRTVRILSKREALSDLGLGAMNGINLVGYESDNQVTNMGRNRWTQKTGEPSIWILGQFRHSPTTTIVVPFRPNGSGRIVNDAYFGKVPSDRLKIGDQDVYFKGDGQYRSKIGISPERAKDVIGSYDPSKGVLTIIKFDHPNTTRYVNSMWEIQKDPFGGDVTNSYNDGPPSPGVKPLGPFYEIESSSPAAQLRPGQTIKHVHRTFHIEGPKEELNAISIDVFGVGLDQISSAFGETSD